MYYLLVFFLLNFTLTFFIIGLVFSIVALIRNRKSLDNKMIVEKFFSYFLLFSFGISLVYNFILHVFFQETLAAFMGWENCPFQMELGVASLGYGVIGIIAYKAISFRSAVVISNSIFSFGSLGGHIYQMLTRHNFTSGNVGVILWTSLLLPLIGYLLLYLQYCYSENSSSR